jgi:uncharacterized protein (TIGR03435 family)
VAEAIPDAGAIAPVTVNSPACSCSRRAHSTNCPNGSALEQRSFNSRFAFQHAGMCACQVREQLGLRMVASKAAVEVIVIDHIEQPSAN